VESVHRFADGSRHRFADGSRHLVSGTTVLHRGGTQCGGATGRALVVERPGGIQHSPLFAT